MGISNHQPEIALNRVALTRSCSISNEKNSYVKALYILSSKFFSIREINYD